MKHRFYRALIIVLICGITGIGFTGVSTNRAMQDSGEFVAGNWDGTWERGVDVEGPLDADAYRSSYTDNNNNIDVVTSSSAVYSWSDNFQFQGTLTVSASYRGSEKGLSRSFWAFAFESISNGKEAPKGQGPIPGFPDISFVSAWGDITGQSPRQEDGVNDDDSGSGQDGVGGDIIPGFHYSAYAHVPF
ncbi:MAG: hypothetical protein OXD54_02600 [Candidatus Poribacteria bacterium]|nr:hypothetical protein [Candidatus Poribacteria bacterium]